MLALVGLNAWARQFVEGLETTGMTNQVSWGAYIANFTFLVGVAAAAVMLVIPAYIYKKEFMHEVVLFGELMAIAVIVMCLLFVTVDLGHPDRFHHMIPPFGIFNLPGSILSWDVIVLNGYLLLNLHIAGYLLYCRYRQQKPTKLFYIPFVFLSIAWAVSIHTVTAFLYVGLAGRSYWHHPLVPSRFLASAFVAGPGLMILTFQIIRRVTRYYIGDQPIFTLRMIMTVAMIINMFLLGCELFTEFYSPTMHAAAAQYLYFGLHGHHGLVPWIWTAVTLDLIGLILLITPLSRQIAGLNVACVACFIGIWIEKGMGLIIPGFVPSPLGQVVEYLPTLNETLVCLGIWAFGALLFSWMLRVAIPIMNGSLRARPELNSSSPMNIKHIMKTCIPTPRPVRRSRCWPHRCRPAPDSPSRKCRPQSKACAECHKKESAAIYAQWGASKHYRGNIGCYECHMALTNEPDAFEHYGQTISTIVTPKDCGRCHEHEVAEFNASHHAKAARILGSLDNVLAEVVEGNRGFKTPAFANGVSAAAVNGCWQCHGAEVKIMRQRQARSRRLAEHRHRPHQPRRQRRLVRRLPFAP